MDKELRLREVIEDYLKVIEDYLKVKDEKVKVIAEVAWNRGYNTKELYNELEMNGITDADKLEVFKAFSALAKFEEVV